MPKNPKPKSVERKRGSGVQFVHSILRDEILDLILPPGSLIDEIQLSERLSMSRTPIREALVRLASEGLVTTLPNRSTVVANIDFINMHTFFDAMTLMYRVTTRLTAQFQTPGDLVNAGVPVIVGTAAVNSTLAAAHAAHAQKVEAHGLMAGLIPLTYGIVKPIYSS